MAYFDMEQLDDAVGGVTGSFMLPRARKKVSAGDTVTQTVSPGPALPNAISRYRQLASDAYKQGAEMFNQDPDYSQLQAFAKQRAEQGDNATLTALAAQFAGPQFEGLQAQLLKKAAASRDPLKVGSGYITAEGGFVKDPEVQQQRRSEFLLNQAKAYEGLAQQAETAQEKAEARRQSEMMLNMWRQGQLQNQADANSIRKMIAANTMATQANTAAERNDKRLSEGTQKLSKQLEDYTNLYSGVQQLNNKLTDYTSKGATIPGIGYGSDISVLGLDVAGAFMGDEGKSNRAMVKNVANELIRLAAGQAVTLNEMERQMLAQMANGKFSERNFLDAWENIVLPKVNEAMANVSGGYTPEIKQRYRDQGGRIQFGKDFTPPRAAAKAAAAPKGVDQAVWNAMTPQERALWTTR